MEPIVFAPIQEFTVNQIIVGLVVYVTKIGNQRGLNFPNDWALSLIKPNQNKQWYGDTNVSVVSVFSGVTRLDDVGEYGTVKLFV